jgi:sugar phosphate isomerase/epimerase
MKSLTRRRFLQASAAAVAASMRPAWAEASKERIAVSTWSFHNYFPNTRYGPPKFETQDWDIRKVITHVKDKIGLTNFEMSSAHFANWEPKYLDDLAAWMTEQGCGFIHLSDNIRGANLARSDAMKRAADVQTFEKLIGVAQRLKIPTMRVNTGTPEAKDWKLQTTIDIYKHLARYGKERGVEIIIENHFGISADPKKVAEIIGAVGENISACPDFGLFKNDDERWPGLETMFRHAKRICSAKFHGFDQVGRSRDFDIQRCYDIMKESKFGGWVSLEYEGPDEPTDPLQKMLFIARHWLKRT